MTDALRAVIGASDRYLDWVTQKTIDNRTGAEIAAEVIKKAGLKMKQSDSSGQEVGQSGPV